MCYNAEILTTYIVLMS